MCRVGSSKSEQQGLNKQNTFTALVQTMGTWEDEAQGRLISARPALEAHSFMRLSM
jgi:hypothetical protein